MQTLLTASTLDLHGHAHLFNIDELMPESV
uniref:Uncharacterized protein n=1 Tax=Arundo donax TaxID=35708 RepID=A0A0A9AUU4_ARUDO